MDFFKQHDEKHFENGRRIIHKILIYFSNVQPRQTIPVITPSLEKDGGKTRNEHSTYSHNFDDVFWGLLNYFFIYFLFIVKDVDRPSYFYVG